MKLKRELEAGWFQRVELPLPAVLSIQSGINKPRYATLKGIMAAKKKEIATVDRATLGVPDAPTQKVERIYMPQKTKKTEFITGQPKEIAAKLVEKLRHEARVMIWRSGVAGCVGFPVGAPFAPAFICGLACCHPKNLLLSPNSAKPPGTKSASKLYPPRSKSSSTPKAR